MVSFVLVTDAAAASKNCAASFVVEPVHLAIEKPRTPRVLGASGMSWIGGEAPTDAHFQSANWKGDRVGVYV